MSTRTVTVIGGGLAGLALGIGLRHRGVPVRILEAGHYPRHRVCGEFISGHGQALLERLGLGELLDSAGAIPARTVRFFFGARAFPARGLPRPAISISRFRLDDLLARAFRDAGGELKERMPWRGEQVPEGFVRASGRRVLPVENGWRWFGVKAHARNVELSADLEMHSFTGGYLGLSRLADRTVNACGIFRRRAGDHASPASRQELLRGAPGTVLRARLGEARFEDGSFCSVAGLPLQPQSAAGAPECRLGDALTMIAPVTGNGMSMAFEAAALAIEPLAFYSRGSVDWAPARRRIAGLCDTAFASRLRWASRLQTLLLHPAAGRFIPCLLYSEAIWRLLFARTRGE